MAKRMKFSIGGTSQRKTPTTPATTIPTFPGSNLSPAAGNLGNAGFEYTPSTPTSGGYPRASQETANRRNTYQRPATTYTGNDPTGARRGIIDATVNQQEVGLRQNASDKAYNEDLTNIANTEARNAYGEGVSQSGYNYDTILGSLARGKDLTVNALQKALTNQKSGYEENEARYQLDKKQGQNQQASMFGNLGTLASSAFTEGRQRFDTLAELAQSAQRERGLAEEQNILGDMAAEERYFGDQSTAEGRRKRDIDLSLANTLQGRLGTIAAGAERFSRDSLLANQGLVNDTTKAQLAAMLGWEEADVDRAIRAEEAQASAETAAANRALQERQQAFEEMRWGQTAEDRDLDRKLKEENYASLADYRTGQLEAKKAANPEFDQRQSAVTRYQFMRDFTNAFGKQGDASFVGPKLPGAAKDVSPDDVELMIYQYAPGTSQSAQQLRRELAAKANTLLKKRGYTGRPVTPTPRAALGTGFNPSEESGTADWKNYLLSKEDKDFETFLQSTSLPWYMKN